MLGRGRLVFHLHFIRDLFMFPVAGVFQPIHHLGHEVGLYVTHALVAPFSGIGVVGFLIARSPEAPLRAGTIIVKGVGQLVRISILVGKPVEPFSIRLHGLTPVTVHNTKGRASQSPLFTGLHIPAEVGKGHVRSQGFLEWVPQDQLKGRPAILRIDQGRINPECGIVLTGIGLQQMEDFVFATLVVHPEVEATPHLWTKAGHSLKIGSATTVAAAEAPGMTEHNAGRERIEVVVLQEPFAPTNAAQYRKGYLDNLILIRSVLNGESEAQFLRTIHGDPETPS